MTKCIIKVTTLKAEYVEEIYGVMESADRVEEIQRCHNVIGIEMMSGETGEILYQQLPNGETYVDNKTLVNLIIEEYYEQKGIDRINTL